MKTYYANFVHFVEEVRVLDRMRVRTGKASDMPSDAIIRSKFVNGLRTAIQNRVFAEWRRHDVWQMSDLFREAVTQETVVNGETPVKPKSNAMRTKPRYACFKCRTDAHKRQD